MRHIARVLTVVAVLIGLAAWTIGVRADPPAACRNPSAAAPRDGILLLKNGQVLAGRITWSGDHYFVDRDGLQVGVRAAEVLATATDMDDAYRSQRERLAKDDLEGRQTLVQWCLRHELLGYAATELAECEALHPGHPRTTVLMRQLQSAVRTAESERAARASDVAPSATNERRDETQNHAERTAKPADASTALSNQSLEIFVTTIQPLLINQCASGGCHGGATSAELKFQRFDPRRSPSRVYTQRNLAAALKYVDRDNPDASKLVVAPSQPHGGMATPVFSGRTLAQQAELAAWVRSTVRGTARPNAREPQATRNVSNRAAASDTSKQPKSPVARAMHEEHAGGNGQQHGQPSPAQDATAASEKHNPHDPDAFNRRFFPQGRAQDDGDTGVPRETAAPRPIPQPPESPESPAELRQTRPREPWKRPIPPRLPVKPNRGSVDEDEIPPFESIEEG